MTDYFKNINLIIADYESGNFNQDIDSLLTMRDKLVIYAYRIAELTAEIKTQFNKQYFIRQISVEETTMNIAKQGTAYNKASAEAKIQHKELFKMALEKEGESYKCDLLLKQINKISEAMNQRISWLKMEREKSKFQNNT